MKTNIPLWLLTVGFVGQLVFTARFLVQWVASEKKRDSVVPVAFWWLSLAGGMLLFVYAFCRQDPVIMVGQSLGVFIYTRNLMLVEKRRKRDAKAAARTAAAAAKQSDESGPVAKLGGSDGTSVRVDVGRSASPQGGHAGPVHLNGTGYPAQSRP
jgi:lipid-A-disaccharide synthase-like uncharacterized protein